MADSSVRADSAFHLRFNKGYELMKQHPDHIPIMFSTSSDIHLEKDTIMCHKDTTLSNIVLQFRKYLSDHNNPNSSTVGYIFYVIDQNEKKILPKVSERIGDLHTKYQGTDMWLVLKIEKEDIFG